MSHNSKLKCTLTNVIFKQPEEPKEIKHGNLFLSTFLKKDTMWVECLHVGPDSILKPGDELLLSRRVVTFKFEHEGVQMGNTSDKSTMAYKRDGKLGATAGTIIYTWLEGEITKEETTESGLVVVQKLTTKEFEPRWAKVVACGPESGVHEGASVLLAFKSDAYTFDIDGVTCHNAGKEEVIAYVPA